jgi:hypothetical protein
MATARHSWKIFTRIRDLLQQAETIAQIVTHLGDLEKRVAALEERLQRCPGEGCPRCGQLTFRAADSAPAGMGRVRREMKCTECGLEEDHIIDPTKQRGRN